MSSWWSSWTSSWFILCLSVSWSGVVGSIDGSPEQQDCSSCLRGTCRSINGLYTRPDLPAGYSLVAQIPKGSCRVLVQQLKYTRNFLALKNVNGSFIINGDWKFSNSRTVEGAGTKFNYVKQDGTSLETITAPGPLANAVDIMIVNYQANPGIKYGYSIPTDPTLPKIAPPLIKRPTPDKPGTGAVKTRTINDIAGQRDEPRTTISHRRTRLRRRFMWKISGMTECSKTCGGGTQMAEISCVHQTTRSPAAERKCLHLPKPSPPPVRCNARDCPPEWQGSWSECSATCGRGLQELVYSCRQELDDGRSTEIAEHACPKPRPRGENRSCEREPLCNGIEDSDDVGGERRAREESGGSKVWISGSWSECSVSCGTGYRTRPVTCPSGLCHPALRPRHAEYCDTGPCSTSAPAVATEPTSTPARSWLVSEWSTCTEPCGGGVQRRLALCAVVNCDETTRPEIERACHSEEKCGAQWVTGEWGECQEECHEGTEGKEHRRVYCITYIHSRPHISGEQLCPSDSRPLSTRPCPIRCPARWFVGDWGECSCPAAVQRRTVRCMDKHGMPARHCSEGSAPIAKRPCTCSSGGAGAETPPVQDQPIDTSCVDKIRNCYLAVQARLCQYPYYVNHCCVSCRRAPHIQE